MATVRAIVTDALMEIGAIGQGDSLSAADGAVALLRFQNQIDAWAADRLTLSMQSQLDITWPTTTSTRTIGLVGADITAPKPTFIVRLTYLIPGATPVVEVDLADMNYDQYAAVTIKALPSALPTSYYYSTAIDSQLGTFYLYPQPSQSLTLRLYAPQAVSVPASLDTVLLGPAGYQEAFMYQLALRLCTPFSRPVPPALPQLSTEAWLRMKRPNLDPGLLGVDAALTPRRGGGYNILSDQGA